METTIDPVAPESREEDGQITPAMDEMGTGDVPPTDGSNAEETPPSQVEESGDVVQEVPAPPTEAGETETAEPEPPLAAVTPPPTEEHEVPPEGREDVPAADVSAEEETEAEAKGGHPMDALEDKDFALNQVRRGQMVRGVIVAKSDTEIVVDIGGKSEGIVPPQDLARLDKEFLSQLNVGDEIAAYVLTPEGREGHTVLSLSKARGEFEWDRMARLQEENATIEATVAEANRGGVVVRVGPLRGFVPASHIVPRPETRRAENPEERFAPLKGETLRLKVLEVDRRRRRLILSEREAEKEEREKRKQALLQELRKGEVRRGRVTSITRFGAFVDLGGVDGLIHISELSWGRVAHPSDVVQVGDEVEVYILDVDRERGRVSLSLRRLQPKPWETVLERYAIGQVVEGTVTRVVPFGAFVRLDDGIEGLVHISELADRYVNHPHEVVKEGDRVQVRILNIDPERKRMGLSIKQASEEEYVEVDWDVAEEDEGESEGTWGALADVLSNEDNEDVSAVEAVTETMPTPETVEAPEAETQAEEPVTESESSP